MTVHDERTCLTCKTLVESADVIWQLRKRERGLLDKPSGLTTTDLGRLTDTLHTLARTHHEVITCCPTCKQPYVHNTLTVCSSSFHCCRDCIWNNGRRVYLCNTHREKP